MTGDRRLLVLAVGHFTLGVIARLLAPLELPSPFGLEHILVVPLFASALCQAFLLALWSTTSRISRWWRMAGLVAGAVYLEALFPSDLRREFFGINAITITVTTVTLLVLRALGVKLIRNHDTGQPARTGTEGLRFSIRVLMLFTAVVGILSAGARALHGSPQDFVLLMVVWALCFVSVGLVTLWAALGNARPLGRGAVALVLSPILGAFFAFAANAPTPGWAYIVLIMLLYPLLLLGSLLVVRSRGYGIVRSAVPS
jgi:hypothetical protein